MSSPITTPAERAAQINRKMNPGTLQGVSRVASPRISVAKRIPYTSQPPEMEPLMRIVSTRPEMGGGYTSDPYYTTGPGDPFTLAQFRVIPGAYGPPDGPVPSMELWQQVPGGDGNAEVARTVLPFSHEPDVVYVGEIFTGRILIGAEYGITFRIGFTSGPGAFNGTIRCEAVLENVGPTVTLNWPPVVVDDDGP